MTSKDEELFVSQVRDTLDIEVLDKDITDRLSAARRNALDELESSKSPTRQNWSWLILAPVGAMAIGLFAIALTLSSTKVPEFPYYESELQAAAAGELDLMEELEFVAWMLAEATDAG